MADEKSQDKHVAVSGEEAKPADSGDNKTTEDAAAADSDSTTNKPVRQLRSHYKGMPRQWEKNKGKFPPLESEENKEHKET
ncbi:hypothetical protein M426DRAFT_323005 [Hypoxylon sp. CI-4A]|nr:hypothetical protein M426DRAFT_323005 [Hypoxylon sp. CI-4A]